MLTRVEILLANTENIVRAAERLREGRLVAMPTETVYGLAAAARDPLGVARVFELKGRPANHPLIVHLAAPSQVREWSAGPVPGLDEVADAFWPGPLTVVVRRAEHVPAVVTGGQGTVALRVPSHPVARQLLQEFGDGLAAPSANRFGRVSPTTAQHVATEFAGSDLLVLDGGPSMVGLESTILDLSGPAPRLLRPGGVRLEELEAVLRMPLALGAGAGSPRVPGSLPSHYAPSAPVRLVGASGLPGLLGAAGAPVAELTDVAVLALHPRPKGFAGAWEQLPSDARGYGAELYAALRRLDATSPAEILVEHVPDEPAWLAVRDRLGRAAAPRDGDGAGGAETNGSREPELMAPATGAGRSGR